MSSHPTADAFMRNYLRTPTDATTRLVFADWLEETGDHWNVAWAHYIRAKIEADQYEPGTHERKTLEAHARSLARQVRASLTIPAQLFVDYPKSLLQLLPAPNITVRLDHFAFQDPIWELIPEFIARDNLVIPLDVQGRILICATPNPGNEDTRQKLEFILNREVIAVGTGLSETVSVINATYGRVEVEPIDAVHHESPVIGLEGDTVSETLGGLFSETFSRRGDGMVMMVSAGGCEVRCVLDEQVLHQEVVSQEVYRRLMDHLLSLEPIAEYHERGVHCVDLELPVVSGRSFLVTLERLNERTRRPDWFLLRFRR